MANFNLNKVIIGGRLTSDPELKQTPSGIAVVSITVAVNRRYQPKDKDTQQQSVADFFTVTAWRATAEFISRFFKKGSSICVSGSIQNRSWVDQQGQKRYATDIIADEVFFVDSRQEGSGSAGQYTPEAYANASFSSGEAAPKFEEIEDDNMLPF